MAKQKRCKERSPITGKRCKKNRDHVDNEIDVVHQSGMFVWRTDKPIWSRGGREVTISKATMDGIDITKWIKDQKVHFPGLQDGAIDLMGTWLDPTKIFRTEFTGVRNEPGITIHTESSTLDDTIDRHEKRRKGQRASSIIYDEAAHFYMKQDGTLLRNVATPDQAAADQAFDDAVCTCPGCTSERVMHSMCTEPCGPTCNVEKTTASAEHQLTEWWMQQAENEIARTVPKAVEYSAVDLMDIGHDLARTMGREVSDEEAAELGVFFYLRGKVARWVGSVMAGTRVSDDTLFDIGVYVRMAQRIREFGAWPGVDTDAEDILADLPPDAKLQPPPAVQPNWSNRSGG